MSNVKLSKALTWVLRHSAPSLGLQLAPDGFVQVRSVLSLDHPRFRKDGQPKFSVDDVIQVVENNDKQRFRLEYRTLLEDGTLLKEDVVDGTTHYTASGDENQSKDHVEQNNTHQSKRVLCIRANQGHSFRGIQADQLLTQLTKEELADPDLTIIHGTTRKAWEGHIQHEGLSRMKRNHIHFATDLPKSPNKPISGMRSSSEIYIYINGRKCADDGIAFYRSDNGVILTAGVKEEGMLSLKYFEKVVYALSGKIMWSPT
jgi:2'-phosphotransferase